ncbi:MAG: hypothetical protein WC564_00710 [Patescibacteria group bacterium]
MIPNKTVKIGLIILLLDILFIGFIIVLKETDSIQWSLLGLLSFIAVPVGVVGLAIGLIGLNKAANKALAGFKGVTEK